MVIGRCGNCGGKIRAEDKINEHKFICPECYEKQYIVELYGSEDEEKDYSWLFGDETEEEFWEHEDYECD